MVVAPSELIDIVVPDFIAKGGDQYFDPDYLSTDYFLTNFTQLPITDQQALQNYIQSFGGDIGADPRYANLNGEDPITAIPEPTTALLLILGAIPFLGRRRRA